MLRMFYVLTRFWMKASGSLEMRSQIYMYAHSSTAKNNHRHNERDHPEASTVR